MSRQFRPFHPATWLLCCSLLFAVAETAHAEDKVFFIEPKDGATVTSPFLVQFGVEGLKVAPAGEVVPGTGHHHLIINDGPLPIGTVIPMDDTHKHFGKGQTETELTLPPGDYTLTLQFADGTHHSYGPALSQTIKVHVK